MCVCMCVDCSTAKTTKHLNMKFKSLNSSNFLLVNCIFSVFVVVSFSLFVCLLAAAALHKNYCADYHETLLYCVVWKSTIVSNRLHDE